MKTSDAWTNVFMSREKKPDPSGETPDERADRVLNQSSGLSVRLGYTLASSYF